MWVKVIHFFPPLPYNVKIKYSKEVQQTFDKVIYLFIRR